MLCKHSAHYKNNIVNIFPPNKPNYEPYDSTLDNNRQIFVCYHDNQCYAEYIIKVTGISPF